MITKYLKVTKEILLKLEALNLSIPEMQERFDIKISKKQLLNYFSKFKIKHKHMYERLAAILGEDINNYKIIYIATKYKCDVKTVARARRLYNDQHSGN